MRNEMDEEVASVLFQRYRSDCASSWSPDAKERRKSGSPGASRSTTPVQIDALEKEWFRSSSTCDLLAMKRLWERDYELINKKHHFTGFAAIHWAAKKGRVDVVEWLFEKNGDLNIRTNGGYSPLHISTIHNNGAIIKKLIEECNADINLRDYSGRKARHYVTQDLPLSVSKGLQDTLSMIDMNVDACSKMAIPAMLYIRASSVPSNVLGNVLPLIEEEAITPKDSLKMKKKGKLRRGVARNRSDVRSRIFNKSYSMPDMGLATVPVIPVVPNEYL